MTDGLFTPKSYPSDALDEAKQLRARVAALEVTLGIIDCMTAAAQSEPSSAIRWVGYIRDATRAALQQEGGE